MNINIHNAIYGDILYNDTMYNDTLYNDIMYDDIPIKKGTKYHYPSSTRKNITEMIKHKNAQYHKRRLQQKIHSKKKNGNTDKKQLVKFSLETSNITTDDDNFDQNEDSQNGDWEIDMWNDIMIRALNNPTEWYEQCLESYKYENKPDEIIVEHLYENIYIMWHSYLMI